MLVAVAVVVAAAAPAACIAAALYRAPASTMISLPVNIRVTAARLVLARAYTRECMHAGKGEAWFHTYRWPRSLSHTLTHTHSLTHSLSLLPPFSALSLHSSHHPPPPSHHLTRSHTHFALEISPSSLPLLSFSVIVLFPVLLSRLHVHAPSSSFSLSNSLPSFTPPTIASRSHSIRTLEPSS